jgi:hypothetical protein
MNNPDGADGRCSGHRNEFFEDFDRYSKILDKLEEINRNVDRHWKSLIRRMIEEEQKKERPQEELEPTEDRGQVL